MVQPLAITRTSFIFFVVSFAYASFSSTSAYKGWGMATETKAVTQSACRGATAL